MIVAAHQLHYLPWLRYFEKIRRSDVFVVLDDAQYNANGWQNRNRIKGAAGAMLLTVPVRHRLGQRIDEIEVAGPPSWRRKHWRSIEQSYARAPWFDRWGPALGSFYERDVGLLHDLSYAMLTWFVEALGLRTRLVRSSELGIGGAATARLVAICRALGATTYLTGEYAVGAYLDPSAFEAAGIMLATLHWQCPTYAQQHASAGFVSDLAIVDLLFNEGPAAADWLSQGSRA